MVLVLALVVAGGGLRLVGTRASVPGAVAYHWADALRPPKDSVATRADRLAQPLGARERIDVDVANAETLTRLPRIGPGLALEIVRDRERRGPFGSLAALARVAGVGPTTLQTMRAHVTFSGTPKSVAAPVVALNAAGVAELARLPGIGPVKARAIVEDRRRHGPYHRLADLTRVNGIGPATVRQLTGLVRVP